MILAVAGGHDTVSVAFERIGEKLLDGFLVVDEENGRCISHGRRLDSRVAACGARLTLLGDAA